ncbi:MAG: hypothetical protein K0S16_1894 [Moraxellaceae bacterium]|nr:hypothetical protein [Moraxellaceae bacterium]
MVPLCNIALAREGSRCRAPRHGQKEYLHRDHTDTPKAEWLGLLGLQRRAEEVIVWHDAGYSPAPVGRLP